MTPRTILVAGKLHPSGLALLDAAPFITMTYIEDTSSDAIVPAIYDADAVLLRTQQLTAAIIDRCPRLAIVSRHGVGYDAVDVAALTARGIPLAIVGDVNSRTVAEHAITLILAACKRLNLYDRSARTDSGWGYRNSLEARELFGRTLLIVGYGRIGRHLARMAAVFGMKIKIYDPYLPGDFDDQGVERVASLDACLSDVDVISLHVPAADQPLLGAAEIAKLKPGAVVVNTARGNLLDERALAARLADGSLQGAGLDVFADEPPGAGNPFSALPTAVLTPHSAGLTEECAERMALAAAQNILDFYNGTLDPALVVNAVDV